MDGNDDDGDGNGNERNHSTDRNHSSWVTPHCLLDIGSVGEHAVGGTNSNSNSRSRSVVDHMSSMGQKLRSDGQDWQWSGAAVAVTMFMMVWSPAPSPEIAPAENDGFFGARGAYY